MSFIWFPGITAGRFSYPEANRHSPSVGRPCNDNARLRSSLRIFQLQKKTVPFGTLQVGEGEDCPLSSNRPVARRSGLRAQLGGPAGIRRAKLHLRARAA